MWDGADVPRVYIRAAHYTQHDQAEVFFAGGDGVFSASKRLPFTVIPDGAIHTYVVDLASHSLYTGTITRLRFDPVVTRAPGDRVDLYSITSQLLGDWDNDGDVDCQDFTQFHDCMNGVGTPTQAGCQVFDFDVDGDVDLQDFAGLQVAFGDP